MKKIVITTIATSALAVGAFAQGSLTSVNNLNTQVTTGDAPNATSLNDATSWLTGDVTLEVFYASTASVTQTQINAINALDGVSGNEQLALINGDGFALASGSSLDSTTTGSVSGYINDGAFDFTGSGEIGLPGAPTSATGWLVFYIVGSGQYSLYSGALAFANGTGQNPNATPAGIPATLGLDSVGSGQGLNLVLSAVPEPGTMALAGLGGLSFFLFRRKK